MLLQSVEQSVEVTFVLLWGLASDEKVVQVDKNIPAALLDAVHLGKPALRL